jgi:hypothetical protein
MKNPRPYGLDDPRTTLLHGEIIQRKPFLKKLYLDWYQTLIHKSQIFLSAVNLNQEQTVILILFYGLINY